MTLENAPMITTDRLVLRPINGDDLAGFVAFAAEADTMEHLGGVSGRHAAWRAMSGLAGAWITNGFGMFSVIERDTQEWVGRIGPHYPAEWPAREVGWGVRRKFAGKGYAFEASKVAIDYAFDVLNWDTVSHFIAPDNVRSIALAERLGSLRIEAATLPVPMDKFTVDRYGQTKCQWQQNRLKK